MLFVTCHVSHVTCHVSRVTCHNFFSPSYKVVKLISGGSVINGAYPVQFFFDHLQKFLYLESNYKNTYWRKVMKKECHNLQIWQRKSQKCREKKRKLTFTSLGLIVDRSTSRSAGASCCTQCLSQHGETCEMLHLTPNFFILIFFYWCYYPHKWRNSVLMVCRIYEHR